MPTPPAPPSPSSPAAGVSPGLRPVRVWDLPTRLFHWLLALAVTVSLATGLIAGEAMRWHFWSGYAVFTLLVFRVLWGLLGGHWSRWHRFVYGPAATLRYLRGRALESDRFDVGHTPSGALSVFALIGVLALQLGTGLVADDEIATIGPLNRLVSTETALEATSWHRGWGPWVVGGLVALHLAAIAYYRLVRRVDLVRPMLGGDKPLPAGTPASADAAPQRLLALVLALACAAFVAWVVRAPGA